MAALLTIFVITVLILKYTQGLVTENFLLVVDLGNYKIIQLDLMTGQISHEILTGIYPRGVAYDPVNKHVYWTEFMKNAVLRADLDGSSKTSAITNVKTLRGLGLSGTSLFYSSEKPQAHISRLDLDQSASEIIINADVQDPRFLVLDEDEGHLYWSDWDLARIERSNLDGTERRLLIGGSRAQGLTLDKAANKMYWIDQYGIWESTLEGNNKKKLYDDPNFTFYDIEHYKGHLLYTGVIGGPGNGSLYILSPTGDTWESSRFSDFPFSVPFNILLYLGNTPLTACPFGFGGEDCTKLCYCIDGAQCIEGKCPGFCVPGWAGLGCTEQCHCENGEHCAEGKCPGKCERFWIGEGCHEYYNFECPVGKFGINCNGQCHCMSDDGCDPWDGTCSDGCQEGWTGQSCQIYPGECYWTFELRFGKTSSVSSQCPELAAVNLDEIECKKKACELGGNTVNLLGQVCSIRKCTTEDLELSPEDSGWDIHVRPEKEQTTDFRKVSTSTVIPEGEPSFVNIFMTVILVIVITTVALLIVMTAWCIRRKIGSQNQITTENEPPAAALEDRQQFDDFAPVSFIHNSSINRDSMASGVYAEIPDIPDLNPVLKDIQLTYNNSETGNVNMDTESQIACYSNLAPRPRPQTINESPYESVRSVDVTPPQESVYKSLSE